MDVKKEHTNRLSIMHGGTIASMGKAFTQIFATTEKLIACLVDLGGSLAVASKGYELRHHETSQKCLTLSSLFATGVSTDLNGIASRNHVI